MFTNKRKTRHTFVIFFISILGIVFALSLFKPAKTYAACPPKIGGGYSVTCLNSLDDSTICNTVCGTTVGCTVFNRVSSATNYYDVWVAGVFDPNGRPCGGTCEQIACKYYADGANVTCQNGVTSAVMLDNGTLRQETNWCWTYSGNDPFTYATCPRTPSGDTSYCGGVPASINPTNTPVPTSTPPNPGSGNISASPNPCFTNGSQCTTGLFWNTNGVSNPAVKRNGVTISNSTSDANYTQWIDVGSPATFTLENTTTGTVLSSVTVNAIFQPAATNTPLPPPTNTPLPGLPSGNISASPNPCTSSSSSTPCSINLSWNTQNALSVTILKNGSLTNVVASGLNGSQIVWISPNEGNVTFNIYEDNAHMILNSVITSAAVISATGNITANPNPCSVTSHGLPTCTTQISWTTSNATNPRVTQNAFQLWTSANDTRTATVQTSLASIFELYDGSTLLDSVTVTAIDPNPSPTPEPTYSVTGGVFIDLNNDRIKNPSEVFYTSGSISITADKGSISTSNGTFQVNNINQGTVRISLSLLPAGYLLVYPLNGPPPTYNVTVGNPCNTDVTTGSTCNSGNIINLNFAINNSNPWLQTIGMDTRMDNGFTSKIPPSPACGSGAYASLSGASTTSGIIYTGDQISDFGNGQASSTNWIVGGLNYPEVFRASGTTLQSAYTRVLNTIQKAGIPITDLATICTLNNCDLPSNLSNGAYQANGNVTITNGRSKLLNNRNYVFLINGTLRISSNIDVPNDSTALFTTSRDIVFDRNIGSLPACNQPADVEGIFSADNDVIIDGINNCTNGADLMLKIGGTVIVNAGLNGGRFINNRNLCAENALYPTVLFSNRLDFLFNLPEVLKTKNLLYQEVAP